MRIATEIIEMAIDRGVSIATAESCTAGMISAALTDIAGSSAAFDRGFVTYSNAAKIAMLGVTQSTLDAHGAVSEPIAAQMTNGALARSEAQIAVSVTGLAGPGGSEHKPEGMVCFGIAFGDSTYTETKQFGPRGRHSVRQATVRHALGMLRQALHHFPLKT